MRILFAALLALSAGPAFASTIHCESPDKAIAIDVDFTWDEEVEVGKIDGVRAKTEYVSFSTYADEDADRAADVLAVAQFDWDRIQVGLESENVGPMTFRLDIVRTADYQPDTAVDKDVVVAGVVYAGSIGTRTVICTGW